MSNLLEYPALIFGGMGSGKSWTTREIIKLKVAAGQKVTVLDPHGSPVEWKGVELITDHEDIAKYLDKYIKELNRRYEEYRNSGLSEDEFTQKLIKEGRNMSVV
ncbi:helicase HerA domain-containing protein [Fortiea contorta]|uniref:helicase HerA domain-containing protein n=1 Tax=Fortiea contorta TaxID=1892405 RepID=UPI00034C7276|nr:DUF87 domain-containing protein [Fortiea contorta]